MPARAAPAAANRDPGVSGRALPIALALAVAVACGGPQPQQPPIRGAAPGAQPPERSPCARVVDHVRALSHAERAELAYTAEQWAAIDRAMADSCEATRWPEPALRCYLGARDRDEVAACSSHLSAEQAADLGERVRAAVR